MAGQDFGLRGKLALGFAALLAILIFLGGESIALLSDLGGSIEVILRENYRSVIACERMKESLERMDSAALFALGGEVENGRSLARRYRPVFGQALQTELGNITLPGEKKHAERLQQLWSSYDPALRDFFDRPAGERRRIYFGSLLPVFQQLKSTADAILLLNQRNMERSDLRAKELAHDATRRMALLLALGTVLAAVSVYLLSRAVLGPLNTLMHAAREIGGGNLDAAVPVTSRDEMGELAVTFNSMAGSLRELRRSDQARLLRARQISQLAIDQLPDAVAAFSDRGEVELVNATAADALGLRPGEPVPVRHSEWVALLVAQEMALDGAPAKRYQEVRRLVHDGEERFYLPRTIPLGERAHRLGTLLVLQDVTETRLSAEMTTDLLATMSHELRTPLAALRSLLAGMEGAGDARREADRLARALDTLDAVARLEGRRQDLRVRPTPPRELIEAAAGEFRSSYEMRGVALTVDAAPEIPQVLADPSRIRLVLGFLLDNALSHTPVGGSVTVRAEAAGDRIHIAVADTGEGIPQEHLDKVFERFYQVPGTEDRGRAGLGLSVARDIVQAHGGEIHLESREGHGTTAWLALPTAQKESL